MIKTFFDPCSMVTNLCYKMLENCQHSSVRSVQQRKVLKDYLCHILGIMIKRFNHSYGACVMILQTLPHYEHLSSVYADLVQTVVVQLGYDSILSDILRELRHTISNQPAAKEKENPNTKAYSQFLIELSDRLAPQLLAYLSLIQDFLDDENYLMRNSIIYIYGEIILKVLNPEAVARDAKLREMRNDLLETLIENIHDCHAMVRCKSLQVWKRICDEKAIPLQYINDVMKRCVERMEDITSSVRKNAFQLLCDLIRFNPFGIVSIDMTLDKIEAEFHKEEAILKSLEEKCSDEMNTAEDGAPDEVQDEERKEKQKQTLVVQQTKVNYLKDMLEFIRQIESAIPKISRLLFSKVQTDVFEVISFFVTCYEHGLVDMLFGIRKMLSLVLFAEKNIKDQVVNAYKRLYLSDSGKGQNEFLLVAKKLVKLVENLTICERDALTEMIGEFVANDELNAGIINVLWTIFASKEAAAKRDKLNSIILLGMIIKRKPEIGEANIDVLIENGLSIADTTTDSDLIIYSETCLVLSYISADASTKSLTQMDVNAKKRNQNQSIRFNYSNEPFKLPNSHLLFERIIDILSKELTNTDTIYWTRMMEYMLQCVFKLADCPVSIAEEIIVKMTDNLKEFKLLNKSARLRNLPPVPLFNEELSSQMSSQLSQENMNTNAMSDGVSRFINFIGILATKTLVFLNQTFVCELKRRSMCKENIKGDNGQMKANKNKATARRKSKSRKSLGVNQSNVGADSLFEEEMGLQGADAEDLEQMLADSICDQKLTQSDRGKIF